MTLRSRSVYVLIGTSLERDYLVLDRCGVNIEVLVHRDWDWGGCCGWVFGQVCCYRVVSTGTGDRRQGHYLQCAVVWRFRFAPGAEHFVSSGMIIPPSFDLHSHDRLMRGKRRLSRWDRRCIVLREIA